MSNDPKYTNVNLSKLKKDKNKQNTEGLKSLNSDNDEFEDLIEYRMFKLHSNSFDHNSSKDSNSMNESD